MGPEPLGLRAGAAVRHVEVPLEQIPHFVRDGARLAIGGSQGRGRANRRAAKTIRRSPCWPKRRVGYSPTRRPCGGPSHVRAFDPEVVDAVWEAFKPLLSGGTSWWIEPSSAPIGDAAAHSDGSAAVPHGGAWSARNQLVTSGSHLVVFRPPT